MPRSAHHAQRDSRHGYSADSNWYHALLDKVLLVIEVADSSLADDHDERLPRSATSGIAEVWIIDVAAQSIEQHSQPRAGQYRTKRTYEDDEQLTAVTVPQLSLRVSQIFG